MKDSPFKLLEPYGSKEKNQFFGRDSEVYALYHLLQQTELVLVYGISGTGKTSLIQAGLPKIYGTRDWLPIYVRQKGDLNDSLKKRLQAVTKMEDKEFSSLPELLEAVYQYRWLPVYLIFDQFEELFTLGTDEERQTFFINLQQLLETKLPCKVILLMREEYIGHLYDYEPIVPNIFQRRFRLEAMKDSTVKQIIRQMCLSFGISLERINLKNSTEDTIIDAIVEQVKQGKKEAVYLPYLQVYLHYLYQEAPSQNNRILFNQQSIEKVGQLDDVLKDFINKKIEEAQIFLKGQGAKPGLAQKILDQFATSEGTKRSLLIFELAKNIKISTSLIEEALSYFSATAKLLRADENEVERYEPVHDVVAKQIHELRSPEDKEFKAFVADLRRNYNKWKNKQRNKHLLLSQYDLEIADFFQERLQKEEEFKNNWQLYFEKSKKHLNQKARQRHFFILGLILLTLLSVGIGGYAFHQKNEAEIQKNKAIIQTDIAVQQKTLAEISSRKAFSTVKAFQAESIENNYPIKSLELAKEAVNITYEMDSNITSAAKIAAFKGFNNNPFLDEFKYDSNNNTGWIWSVMVNKLNNRIIIDHSDGGIQVRKTDWTKINNISGSCATFNNQGNKIFILKDSQVNIFDLDGNIINTFKIITDEYSNSPFTNLYINSSEDKILITNSKIYDNTLGTSVTRIYTIGGKLLSEIRLSNTNITNAIFSKDGNNIITSSLDNNIRIWSLKGDVIKKIPVFNSWIHPQSLSSDGKFIITAGVPFRPESVGLWPESEAKMGRVAGIWNFKGEVIKKFPIRIKHGEFDKNSNAFVLNSVDSGIIIGNLSKEGITVIDEKEAVYARLNSNMKIVATSSKNGIKIWSLDGKLKNHFIINQHNEMPFTLSQDGFYLYSSHCPANRQGACYNLKMTSWNLQTPLKKKWDAHTEAISHIEKSGNNEFLVTASSNLIKIWDNNYNLVKTFVTNINHLKNVILSHEGRFLLLISKNKETELWSGKNNNWILLEKISEEILSAKFSKDEQYLYKEIFEKQLPSKGAKKKILITHLNDLTNLVEIKNKHYDDTSIQFDEELNILLFTDEKLLKIYYLQKNKIESKEEISWNQDNNRELKLEHYDSKEKLVLLSKRKELKIFNIASRKLKNQITLPDSLYFSDNAKIQLINSPNELLIDNKYPSWWSILSLDGRVIGKSKAPLYGGPISVFYYNKNAIFCECCTLTAQSAGGYCATAGLCLYNRDGEVLGEPIGSWDSFGHNIKDLYKINSKNNYLIHTPPNVKNEIQIWDFEGNLLHSYKEDFSVTAFNSLDNGELILGFGNGRIKIYNILNNPLLIFQKNKGK